MKISIAIPTYESHGNGWIYLSELLNSIVKQTEKEIEVVVSDQSTDNNVKNLCDYYNNFLNLKYVNSKNTERSNSVNANIAIKNCSADLIKIMFGDDFFVDENSVKKICDQFENKTCNWLVNGCLHCKNIHSMFRPFIPYYNEDIHLGINTISSPSVLTFRGKHYFDEKLIMLMDCDMYKQLYDKFGNPFIIKDYLICNRLHETQMQNIYQNKLAFETEYCKIKYSKEIINA
jgi:glycosyltransferase involved in cell wall biosynthesis